MHGSLRYRRNRGADKFNINNLHVCEFHFNASDIIKSGFKGKKPLKRSTVTSIHGMQENSRTCT